MAEIIKTKLKARLQQKHDTEANWIIAGNKGFTPLAGELIVYDVDSNYNYERFKIGDGTSTVTALPFITDALEEKINNQDAVVLAEAQVYADSLVDALPAWAKNNTKPTYNQSEIVDTSDYVRMTAAERAKLAELDTTGANVQSDWAEIDTTSDAYIKNKPTIPTVNNGTLTIQKNGTTVKTFTANSSSNVTANITVPTKISELTNDSSFISSYTETDPTVPSWAKASTKPSYTASEVGAVPTTRKVNGKALSTDITIDIPDALADLSSDATHRTVTDTEKATWNAKSNFSGSYNDLTNKPTIPSITGLATETYVDNKVASIVDSSPEALNTLNELAAALGDDPNFATTVATEIGKKVDKTITVNGHALSSNVTVTKSDVGLGSVVNTGDSATPVSGGTTKFTTGGAYTELAKKVDKVDGKGLSTNDYTTAEKNKLAAIAENANNYSLPVAGSSLGGVKSGGDVYISPNGVISVKGNMPTKCKILDADFNLTEETPSNSYNVNTPWDTIEEEEITITAELVYGENDGTWSDEYGTFTQADIHYEPDALNETEKTYFVFHNTFNEYAYDIKIEQVICQDIDKYGNHRELTDDYLNDGWVEGSSYQINPNGIYRSGSDLFIPMKKTDNQFTSWSVYIEVWYTCKYKQTKTLSSSEIYDAILAT